MININLKLFKVLLFVTFLCLLSNCGYQPLFSEKYGKYSIEKNYIEGNRRLGQILTNNFAFSKNTEKKATLYVNANKSRKVSDRASSGKIKEYTTNIIFDIKVIDSLTKKTLIQKKFSSSGSYKASTLYLDTLNNEKRILDNLITSIAEQILNELSLIQN
tara:strand:- start:144 stop:623 length:480 start_codon:yes stop_codon:yes gene_type:complete